MRNFFTTGTMIKIAGCLLAAQIINATEFSLYNGHLVIDYSTAPLPCSSQARPASGHATNLKHLPHTVKPVQEAAHYQIVF